MGQRGGKLPARSGEGGWNERRENEKVQGVREKEKNQITTEAHTELILMDEIKGRKLKTARDSLFLRIVRSYSLVCPCVLW